MANNIETVRAITIASWPHIDRIASIFGIGQAEDAALVKLTYGNLAEPDAKHFWNIYAETVQGAVVGLGYSYQDESTLGVTGFYRSGQDCYGVFRKPVDEEDRERIEGDVVLKLHGDEVTRRYRKSHAVHYDVLQFGNPEIVGPLIIDLRNALYHVMSRYEDARGQRLPEHARPSDFGSKGMAVLMNARL